MPDVKVATMDGAGTVLEASIVEAFETSLRGELLREGSTYDEARRIHNGMIDRRPALIVRCAGVADVMHAVKLARDRNLLMSVRGGGHGLPGFAVCNGGLMVDLSPMKSIRVDPRRRTARAEGGVTWGEFDHETTAFDLATTGGVARPTGIAGLTLAGGHGFLMRQHGLACDNLRSADVVTADGRLLTASTTENPDLFWGLRGGGGNFGIVTSFEFQLHAVGSMLGGLLIYPMDQAKELLRFYDDFVHDAPDELGSLAILATLPDGTPAVVMLLGYNGPVEHGEKVLRPLRDFGKPLEDRVGPLPYTALQSIVENFNPRGLRNYWKTSYLQEVEDEAVDAMLEHHASTPAPQTHTVIYTLGGAMSRIGNDDTAVTYREARHALLIVGMWSEAAQDEGCVRWVRELWSAMQPFSSEGFYPNYDGDADPDRLLSAFGPTKYERLATLKKEYDPANLFRLNQNIRPKA